MRIIFLFPSRCYSAFSYIFLCRGIEGFAHGAQEFRTAKGFGDEVQAFLDDKIGVNGILAVAAGEEKAGLRTLGLNPIHDVASAELGHDDVEQRQRDGAAMFLENLQSLFAVGSRQNRVAGLPKPA